MSHFSGYLRVVGPTVPNLLHPTAWEEFVRRLEREIFGAAR